MSTPVWVSNACAWPFRRKPPTTIRMHFLRWCSFRKNGGIPYHGPRPSTGRGNGSEGEKTDIALRVMADHIRAVSSCDLMTDNFLQTRARDTWSAGIFKTMRFGMALLSWISKSRSCVAYTGIGSISLKAFYELEAQTRSCRQSDFWGRVSFLRTLERGLNASKVCSRFRVEQAFELYGIRLSAWFNIIDCAPSVASVDEAGFETEMEKQKNRSQSWCEQGNGVVAVRKDG